MAKRKSIGLAVFGVCCVVYARTAFLAPTEEEMKKPSIAETNPDFRADDIQQGLFRGLRYYVAGVGVIGLLIAVEDHFLGLAKRKKTDPPPESGPPSGVAPR